MTQARAINSRIELLPPPRSLRGLVVNLDVIKASTDVVLQPSPVRSSPKSVDVCVSLHDLIRPHDAFQLKTGYTGPKTRYPKPTVMKVSMINIVVGTSFVGYAARRTSRTAVRQNVVLDRFKQDLGEHNFLQDACFC